MVRNLKSAVVFLAWAISLSASADFVLPWEVRVGGSSLNVGLGVRRMSALVILPESSANYFGHDDALSDLLLGAHVRNTSEETEEFWSHSVRRYADKMTRMPDTYGARVGELVEKLVLKSDPRVHPGPRIVLTDYRSPRELLAMLREAGADANGLVPSEAHYLNHGLEGRPLERSPVAFADSTFPKLEWSESTVGDHFRLDVQNPIPVQWPRGGNIEMKNLSLGNIRAFSLVYLIGRAHRFLAWGGEPIPNSITNWPDGSPFKADTQGLGMMAARIKIAAFEDPLKGFYEKLGFVTERSFKNKETFDLNLNLMQATVETIDRVTGETLFPKRRGSRVAPGLWLYPDPELLSVISQEFRCPKIIAAAGTGGKLINRKSK